MRNFNSQGKLERKCIGTIKHSEYKACYVIYIRDVGSSIAHHFIELSYAAIPTGLKVDVAAQAKKYAKSKGINLVEIY